MPIDIQIPPNVLALALAYNSATGKDAILSLIDSAEWQLRCPLPEENEVAFYVRFLPDRPTRYFISESYGGAATDWAEFLSIHDCLEKTRAWNASLFADS